MPRTTVSRSRTARTGKNGVSKKRVTAVRKEMNKRQSTTTKRRPKRTQRRPAVLDKTIHLAMSVPTANYLRVILNRARIEDDGVDAVRKELKSQLEEV